MFKQVLSILACVAAGVLTANTAFAQADTPRGNAANGKKLFETIGCFECHGYVGQGGGAGPKLVEPMAYPAYIVQLRTPRQIMPPYTLRVLSDQQAADIYAHLLTLPKPVDVKNIPLLQN